MKLFFRFVFSSILFLTLNQFIYSQFSDSTSTKWNLIKASLSSDSYLKGLMEEQERLASKLKDLQERQSHLEIQRDRSEDISPVIIKDAENLQRESDFLSVEIKNLKKELNKIQGIAEKKYLKNLFGVVRYIREAEIPQTEKTFANICFINGKILIAGIIKGDLALINADAYITTNGKVDGKIILINSRILAENKNINLNIETGTIEKDDEPYNEYAIEDNQYSFNFSSPWKIGNISHPVIRYNRVEGLYLGIKDPKNYYWSGRKKYSLYGDVGYGFSNHFWSGNANLDMWIGNYTRSEIGGEGHVLVDSKDNWLIKDEENTIASFFIHEDFKDYYKKQGWSVHFSQYIEKSLRLRADYVSDKYSSMENNTEWALFGGDKKFRLNPKIDEGNIKSTIFSLNYITVSGREYLPTGWNILSSYEIAKGDYEFNRFLIDVRRYQKLSQDIRINGRLMLGTGEKDMPVQRSFDLGGLGTLPALRYKEANYGNRMILGNVELIVKIPDGEEFLPFEIFNGNDLVIFYDAGMLRFMHPEVSLFDGFENIKSNEIMSDMGAALSFNRGSVRIGAAFRIDKSEPARFFLRLTQPF